eukprot:4249380-Pleurochrysis_carterae.AAC.2
MQGFGGLGDVVGAMNLVDLARECSLRGSRHAPPVCHFAPSGEEPLRLLDQLLQRVQPHLRLGGRVCVRAHGPQAQPPQDRQGLLPHGQVRQEVVAPVWRRGRSEIVHAVKRALKLTRAHTHVRGADGLSGDGASSRGGGKGVCDVGGEVVQTTFAMEVVALMTVVEHAWRRSIDVLSRARLVDNQGHRTASRVQARVI